MADLYDHAEMAARIGIWRSHGEGIIVGTGTTTVEISHRTMYRILDAAERNAALVAEVRRLRAENAELRELVGRFYTQAWEDPLTPEQSHLLDSIVEADR